MNKKTVLAAVIFSIFSCLQCFAREQTEYKTRLAILDLSAKDIPEITASKVSDLIRVAMSNASNFTVLERKEMEAALREQSLSLSGCTDEMCGVRIGRILSANKVLLGTVMQLGGKIVITARVVDVEKGKIDYAEKVICLNEGTLDAACDNLAAKIAKRMSDDQDLSGKEMEGEPREIISTDDSEMVLIPAGEFTMGSAEGSGQDDEHPRLKVFVDAYYIDRYEVRVGQYRRFCKATSRAIPSQLDSTDENHPVTNVTWFDAAAYAQWAGKRLPTEAEWEKACRAGSDKKYCFGDDEKKLSEYAWYTVNSENRSHRIGGKTPNSWGIYDMHGNLWEWCADWYGENYYKVVSNFVIVKNPRGPESGEYRILRGGSWGDEAGSCRSAYRYWFKPVESFDYFGFRCVKSVRKTK